MRLVRLTLTAVALAAGIAPAEARDTEYRLKIAEVLQNPEFQSRLGNGVAFYFGNQKTPLVQRTLGSFVTNKKTNAANKSDEEACRWAMLSALMELRERAEKEGGNAVGNIVSYYKKVTTSSETDYVCHAGAIIAGVALKGTVLKVGK